MKPFASVADYTARYGPVDDEKALYECLMDATGLMCDEMDAGDVEYSGQSESFTDRLRRICRQVAHRAFASVENPDVPFGATALHEVAADFSSQASFANPYGDLFLTAAERTALGIGGAQACVVSPYG